MSATTSSAADDVLRAKRPNGNVLPGSHLAAKAFQAGVVDTNVTPSGHELGGRG
jgi:hypothetical protein